MNSGILWMENQKPVILSPYDSVLPPARMSELLKKCHILRLFEIQPNRNVQEAEFKHLRGHGGEKTESGMTIGSRQHGRNGPAAPTGDTIEPATEDGSFPYVKPPPPCTALQNSLRRKSGFVSADSRIRCFPC